MLKKTFTILLPLILLCLVACEKKTSSTQQVALVSIAPYIYFVQKIAGLELQVQTLVPETSNPHIYEPKPKEIQDIGHARIWLRLGDPADQKVYQVLKEKNPGMMIVELTKGIELLPATENGSLHCHEEEGDLHIWLSPRLAMKQAMAIAQGLIEAFPEHRALYQEGLKTLIQELHALDQEITEMLEPKKGETILVSHPALAYFCRDYDLKQLSIEIEGKDPLPQNITELLRQAKNAHVTIALLQPQYSNKGAQLIAEELEIPTATVNPYAQDYLNNLRHIAEVIAHS